MAFDAQLGLSNSNMARNVSYFRLQNPAMDVLCIFTYQWYPCRLFRHEKVSLSEVPNRKRTRKDLGAIKLDLSCMKFPLHLPICPNMSPQYAIVTETSLSGFSTRVENILKFVFFENYSCIILFN